VTDRVLTPPSHADDAHELYRANIELLGWAHSILNAESPEDGKAGLLKPGDRLDTWPRMAATEIRRLRAERDLLRAEVTAWRDWDQSVAGRSWYSNPDANIAGGSIARAIAAVDAFDKEATRE